MDHIQALRERLGDLDAVLLTGEANRFYITGFFSTGTDGAALVTKERTYYLTDGRYTEAAERTLPRDVLLRETKPGRGYSALLSDIVKEDGLKRVGFEDAAMTVADHARYCKALPCALVPASKIIGALRHVKDREEQEALMGAQRIAEKALEAILKELRPGVAEREIAARLQYLMLSFGASDMSFDPIVVSGPNGSLPHGVPSERTLREGEFVTMDFGCVWRGYCSDMTRTVAIGYATEEMRRVYDTVLSAQTAGIAAARAGVTGKAVDAAARTVIEEAGYGPYFSHSFGHGVGVEIHEPPNASSLNEEPFPAGAVISAEPGIYIPGKLGVRIEDVLILTEDGCRDITLAPKELLIL